MAAARHCVALFFITLLTFDILYSVYVEKFVKPDDWDAFITSGAFKIWIIWAPTTFLNVGFATFAVRRLILHPKPPERVKEKVKKDSD